MKKHAFSIAFVLGALATLWVAATVASSHLLVLVMTAVIAGVYLVGALELRQYRATTESLNQALSDVPAQLTQLGEWLSRVPTPLQNAVRQRVEGERGALPGPALTPYLVGLLVMLGMLGTFLGMVVTLNGAVFALEGASSVQGMRAAFSEPVKGLGLAFGTSVAGVATSAMLGLMSSLARRERALSAQALDALIGSGLRAFSLAHQRRETFMALQQQSQALPAVVQQLQSLMTQMERHSQQLGERLLTHQDQFHREVKTAYTDLAQSVDQTLRGSLTQSMHVASDSIRPVVQSTMTEMAQHAKDMHERMVQNTREQLDTLNQQFGNHAQSVAQTWSAALSRHEQTSSGLLGGLDQALERFSTNFDTRAQALVTSVQSSQAAQQANQASADQQRLDAWTTSLQEMSQTLQSGWQTVGSQTLAQQQQVCDSLGQTATQIRNEAEALTRTLRHELVALREQEAQRGDAAVAHLAELQTTVTQHLSTLGTALEAPISRLIETASQAPKAAAEVIGQLRQEISVSVARDNTLLEERTRILDTLSTLLDAINHASTEQRGVIDALVTSSKASLAQASEEFQAHVASETGKLGDIAAQVTASAVDVASLGETFGFAVRSFNETNEKLMLNLQGIEAAIARSMARSDEQLAYYVAQAREIIDLSISSQKDVLEALQQRQAEGAA